MTYAETIEFLFGIRLFGQKLGLETMRELCARLGHPERHLRFIHIAGTNGKGSVAAMCHSVLTAAGYRTGLYTSPHLVSFCERFQINGRAIAEADVVRLVAQIQPLLADFPERSPTFFEVVTGLALAYFREQDVDIVVWETGMGGRLDATNVVTPLVAVLTNIGFDHMQYLGDTIEQIAAEKAGIIKPGIPVVSAATGAALDLIRRTCAERNAPLHIADVADALPVPLPGAHQRINSATAVAALRATGLKIPDTDLHTGLANTRWPGRFQIVPGHPVVVLDGAHNPPAARILADSLQAAFPGRKLAFVLGVLRDKDVAGVCQTLAPLAEVVCCTPVNSERSGDPIELAKLCPNGRAFHTLADAYEAARQAGDVVVITGSLFLVGEAMTRLGLGTPATPRELVLQ